MPQHADETGLTAGPERSAPLLRIYLLGGFRLSAGAREIPYETLRRQKARHLIKLLCLAPNHRIHREEVIEQLWPDLDPTAAGNNLRGVVHLTRGAFREATGSTTDIVLLQDDLLSLREPHAGAIWIDVDQFKMAAARAHERRDISAYREAIGLYTGDLLPEDRYEEWAAIPRETLRETYLNLLIGLADRYQSSGDAAAAAATLERMIAVEPTHEDAYVQLMRLHALDGRPGLALRQFARLRAVLTRELDIEPSAATEALHADIIAGRFPPGGVATAQREIPVKGEEGSPPPRHNLPATLTRFIGRGETLAELRERLGTARLLTLTGAGGSGKTRLAIELARSVVDRYDDGVWLVDLSGLTDGGLVPHAVASTLRIAEQPSRDLVDVLGEACQSLSLLLILDNCEHVIDACATLASALLAACPGLRILATSREALRIPGELAWRVPLLPLPEQPAEPSRWSDAGLATVEATESVSLFLDRIRWARPDFVLTSDNAAAVVDICRMLDGLPLALELAAARAAMLGPQQIVARLHDAIDLLSDGGRTVASRQQTLRATLDWSYALLDDDERELLERVSIFAGGWTLDAAEQVCAGTNSVLGILTGLVAKSLVQVDDQAAAGPGGPEIRYRLLETVRQYAAARLAERGDTTWLSERYAAYYLSMLVEAEPAFRATDATAWLERIDRERDNLRAVLGWAIDQSDVELEARLCSILWRYWYLRGQFVEGERWLNGALGRLENATVPPLVHGKTLQGAAALAWNRGDPGRSRALSLQALPLLEQASNPTVTAVTVHALGIAGELQGDYAEARRRYSEVLRLFEEAGDTFGIAATLHSLANLDREEGDLALAADRYERSIALHRQIGHRRGLALALAGLAVVSLDQGDYALAAALSAQAIEMWEGIGAVARTVNARNNLGYALMFQGNVEGAIRHQSDTLRIAVDAGDNRGIAYGLEGLASAIAYRDPTVSDAERAMRLFGAAEALREDIQVPLPPADQKLNARSLENARNRLGESVARAALLRGRTLPLDQVIEDALRQSVRPSPDTTEPPGDVTPQPAPLSRREREVALLVADGHTNREIAARLGMSVRTVDTHVSNMLRKLGLPSRAEVRNWAIRADLIPADD